MLLQSECKYRLIYWEPCLLHLGPAFSHKRAIIFILPISMAQFRAVLLETVLLGPIRSHIEQDCIHCSTVASIIPIYLSISSIILSQYL